jgi:alkylation response protein AidB-like acyl-CoA dehydrogenase
LEHRYNDQTIPLAKEFNILGLPVPEEFGGRGWSYLYRPGRHLVDNRVCRIYEGADEILKLKIASGVIGEAYGAYS